LSSVEIVMADRSPAAHLRMKQTLNHFQKQHNDYSHKIGRLTMQLDNLQSEEHALFTALDKLLKQLKFKSMVSEKVFYGKDSKKQCDESTQKELYLSQMKLHSRKTRLSMLRHGNRVLKQQITESRLLKNKAVEDAERLRTQFEKQAVDMAHELDTANGYQTANMLATNQLTAWLEKGKTDMQEFNRECKEKEDILSAFKKGEDFIMNASKRLHAEGQKIQQTGEMSIAEERAVREQMYKLSHNLNKDRRSMLASHEKLISFETAFKILREHTGEQDVNKIVKIFVDREDDCFGMYTFLQRLNTQIQNDESQSIKVHAQITKLTEELEESKKTNHRLLADVEKKRDQLLQKVQNSKKNLQDFHEKINKWCIVLENYVGQALKSNEPARSILIENYPELSHKIETITASKSQRPITPKKKLARLSTPDTARKSKSPRLSTKALQPRVAHVINDKNILQTLSLVEAMTTEIVELYSSTGVDKSLKKLYKFGLPAPPHPRRSGGNRAVTRIEIPSFDSWFDHRHDDTQGRTNATVRPFSVEMLRQSVSASSMKSPARIAAVAKHGHAPKTAPKADTGSGGRKGGVSKPNTR